LLRLIFKQENTMSSFQMKKMDQAGKDSEKIRVQFDFNKQSLENLDSLVKALNASSRAEVLRRALTLLAEAIDESREGRRLGFMNKDGSFSEIRFY
jgi:hypothetical protein